VTGIEGLPRDLDEGSTERRPISPPQAARLAGLDGKHVGDSAWSTQLVAASEHEAEVSAGDGALAPLDNVRMHLPDVDAEADIYAKVMEVSPSGTAVLRFTTLPPSIRSWLVQQQG
jgi:hypothetical protein